MFLDAIKKVMGGQIQVKKDARRELIRREAQIGGQLFGEVPKGHDRQFFCLDRNTWVWHEEWIDENGKPKSVTTRYEVHANGILKIQDGQPYQYTSKEETMNLLEATTAYKKQIYKQIYSRA